MLAARCISADYAMAKSLLHMWWAEVHRWVLDKPNVSPDNVSLLHATLHHMATHGPPDVALLPHLGDRESVTIQLAPREYGQAGSVSVPNHLWAQWADPHFSAVGACAPSWSASSKMADLLLRLHADDLLHKSLLSPTTRAFVKYKSALS